MEEKPKNERRDNFVRKPAKISFERGKTPIDPDEGWAELERRVKPMEELADISTKNQIPFPPMK